MATSKPKKKAARKKTAKPSPKPKAKGKVAKKKPAKKKPARKKTAKPSPKPKAKGKPAKKKVAKKKVAKKKPARKKTAKPSPKPKAKGKPAKKKVAKKKPARKKMAKPAPKPAAKPKTVFGQFCWHDLMTNDPRGSGAFYSELFGWQIRQVPMGGAPMTIAYAGDEMVAGIMKHQQPNMPTFWMPYVTVADLDACTRKAKTLGGQVPMPSMDVPGLGRFGVVVDPEGAASAPFQGLAEMPEPKMGPGQFCWHEIISANPQGALRFYTQLYGWGELRQDMPSGPYQMFTAGKQQVAGVLPRPAEVKGPPMWLSYVAVSDVDASANLAVHLGGVVHMPPMAIPSVGRFAVIGDPQQAAIALFQG
jgi:predicted enzyme related to lactoylglutathione lyase